MMFHMETYTPEGLSEGHMAAISDIDGSYIGTVTTAEMLADMGIAAQAIPGNKVASIGFCEREQKWYGWSHRAICGFGIGSRVEKGDIAYVPTDWDDLIEDAVRFWDDEFSDETIAVRGKDGEGRECVVVEWVYAPNTPNERIRGTTGSANYYPPEKWGRGEWTAETLDDAKQMATDYANDIA